MEAKPIPTFALLRKAFGGYKWYIALLGVLGFLSSLIAGIGIGAVIPFLSFVIGDAGESSAGGIARYIALIFKFFSIPFTLKYLLLGIVVLFMARAVILMIFGYLSAYIRADFKERTTTEIISYMLRSRWSFFGTQKVGYVNDVIFRDVDSAGKLLESLALVLLSFLSIVILSAFAFAAEPRLTLMIVVAGAFLLFLFRPLVRKTRKLGQAGASLNKDISQFVTEHTLGMKTVKSTASEEAVRVRGFAYFAQRRILELKRAILATFTGVAFEPISIVFVAYAFAVAYKAPGFNIQVFAATLFLIQRIFLYLNNGQTALHLINDTIPHATHVVRFKEALAQEREEVIKGKPFVMERELLLQSVFFSYPSSRAPVLADINLRIKKGEVVGLMGPSGAGKTSLADILMRLYDPSSGVVVVDGILSKEFDLISWRKNIGYVAQDPFLLNDTIKENIIFYDRILQDKDVAEAAERAQIYDFIKSLPHDFETLVGERGTMLSGGQRQRVALARILARRPAVLILDEATSALDSESESAIQRAIEKLKGEVTVIIIAHRLSTVKHVDRLLVLDQGKIVEEGTPEELLANPASYFHKMHHLQEVKL
ncbi:MAG: ABC transporter ATP-binding protein [Candidatus Sungiibacteriota bacterium]|uniref:ABC transporter ATP-binding protein n=1 Tax=Candidatus Sungiibacteriota bacterium TaxID=2750080 RepID=A0A7T5RJX6_9BACT|nr:MAG: ABC transporter ATP-binding protein [Candidatus Sungbacteria bacterium]